MIDFPNPKPVYIRSSVEKINIEYIPGFLAFREFPTMFNLFKKVQKDVELKQKKIDAVLIDGNGELHPRQCGLASHFGVLADVPTIGCAKTIFVLDGITRNTIKKIKKQFKDKGEVKGIYQDLVGKSKRIWGKALKATEISYDPLIVTRGHKVGLNEAVELVTECCVNRVPEPIRIADKESRRLIKLVENDILSGKILNKDLTKKWSFIFSQKYFLNSL